MQQPEIKVGDTIYVDCESGTGTPLACEVVTLSDMAKNIVVRALDEADFLSVVHWKSVDRGKTYSWVADEFIAPWLPQPKP